MRRPWKVGASLIRSSIVEMPSNYNSLDASSRKIWSFASEKRMENFSTIQVCSLSPEDSVGMILSNPCDTNQKVLRLSQAFIGHDWSPRRNTPMTSSLQMGSAAERCRIDRPQWCDPGSDPTPILNELLHEMETNCESVGDIRSLPRLPPPEGICGRSLDPSSTDLQSLSTKVTRVEGFVTRFKLTLPTNSVFHILKGKQERNETTSEVQRQWVEVWPEAERLLLP